MTLRTFFFLGVLVFSGILYWLCSSAYEDHSAEVGEIVQLLRLDGYTKKVVEPNSQIALLALKRKELANKLLEAGQLHDKRKKDLSKLQNEMFAALAKTKYDASEARKLFESGKAFNMNEPLGSSYHKWKEAQTAAEGLARINIWVEKQEKDAPLYEFTGKIKTLIYNLEEGELLKISPEEQKEIDRLLATNARETTLTSTDVVEPEKVQDLIWEQQEKKDASADIANSSSTEEVDRHLLEQYAGMDKQAKDTTASSGADVGEYIIRPIWFQKALYADLAALAICCLGFVLCKRRGKAVVVPPKYDEPAKCDASKKQDVPIQKENNEWQLKLKQDEIAAKERERKKEAERVRVQNEMFDELLMLFSESEDYHRSVNAAMSEQLKGTRIRLAQVPSSQRDLTKEQNSAAVLEILKELQQWWKEYRQQNDVRFLQFWRPDSWDQFELGFPNQQVTKELKSFCNKS